MSEKAELKQDILDMALTLRSGSTKGQHVTGIFDVPVLVDYVKQEIRKARREALQWALNDLNMSDTDTKENLEGYIKELEEA